MAEEFVVTGLVEMFKGLCSSVAKEISMAWGVKGELKKLQKTLEMIVAVTEDAEAKQVKDKAVRLWLKRLKDVAYDAEDIMDEFSYETMRRCECDRKRDKVRDFVTGSNPIAFCRKMAHKIKNIKQKLDEIARDKDRFNVQINLPTHSVSHINDQIRENRETTSYVDDSEVIGRDMDRSKILNMLLMTTGSSSYTSSSSSSSFSCSSSSSSSSSNYNKQDGKEKLSVIPIVGLGGLGKTTLAQLVYNNECVKKHFDLGIWVFVSEDFDVKRILRDMISSIIGSKCDDASSMDLMVRRVHESLNGKKFLLVLDDLWNENREKWERLKSMLTIGAQGSKIIVTTRSDVVASIVRGLIPSYHLGKLSEDECWFIIRRRAFAPGGALETTKLVSIGKEIVKKCGGVPLAARCLGGLLYSKKEDCEWLFIRDSKIWDLPEDEDQILPALKLSYDHLPPYLRQCFSCCSLFPKGHWINKEMLIQLWITEGFLHRPEGSNKQFEDIGNDHFNILLWNSFFNAVDRDENGEIVMCQMHDLVYDLAQVVARSHECSTLEISTVGNISEVRHLRLVFDEQTSEIVPKALENSNKLRTFFGMEGISNEYIQVIVCNNNHIRVLNFSCAGIQKIPPVISKLKHIRYFDLSHTEIEVLPDWMSTLYNLQTLILRQCRSLRALPKRIGSLKHLRYLDLYGCYELEALPESISDLCSLQTLNVKMCPKLKELLPRDMMKLINLRHLEYNSFGRLTEMPSGIGHLTNLQTLKSFVVGKNTGCGVGELKHLNFLKGGLHISELNNVTDGMDAQRANLKEKQNLRNLVLQWSDVRDANACKDDELVLEGLQPNPNLKILGIYYFMGTNLPSWMMTRSISQSLPNLVEVELGNCSKCEQLPGLGQLPFLRVLEICGMPVVERLGSDFYGEACPAFPSLTKLTLIRMQKLEEWVAPPVSFKFASCFPCLEKLIIKYCPKLISSPTVFPSLKQLEVINGNLTTIGSVVNIALTTLTSISIRGAPELFSLPQGLILNNNHLQSLVIRGCLKFQGFSTNKEIEVEKGKMQIEVYNHHFFSSSLANLEICDCPNLSFVPDLRGLKSLKKLCILGCEGLKSSLDGLRCLNSLKTIEIGWFPKELNIFPVSVSKGKGEEGTNIQHYFISLKCLSIDGGTTIKSLPEHLQYLTTLQYLNIKNVDELVTLPEWLGNLSSLRNLKISNCKNLMHLPSENGIRGLSSIETLKLAGVSESPTCFPAEGIQHFVSLRELEIWGWSKLKSLPHQLQQLTKLSTLRLHSFNGLVDLPEWLGNLSCLQYLDIFYCDKLTFLPSKEAMQRLTSLRFLDIKGCPLLKERCKKETGEEWYKISHIASVWIY